MKRIRILLWLLLCVGASLPSSISAQIPSGRISRQAEPAKIESLLRICQRQLDNERYEPAYQTASQALALSERSGDKKRQMRATSLLAIAAFHTNRTSEAIRYFKQYSATAEEAGIVRMQGLALSRAGMLLRLPLLLSRKLARRSAVRAEKRSADA